MYVVGVLQETEDTEWRAGTKPQLQDEYFMISYTLTSIRLPHLC